MIGHWLCINTRPQGTGMAMSFNACTKPMLEIIVSVVPDATMIITVFTVTIVDTCVIYCHAYCLSITTIVTCYCHFWYYLQS